MVAALMNRHAALALVINLMLCPAGSIKGGVHVGDTWSVVYCVRYMFMKHMDLGLKWLQAHCKAPQTSQRLYTMTMPTCNS